MVLLRVLEHVIPDGYILTAMQWQLSITETFEGELVIDIPEDKVNINSLYSNIEVTSGTTYHSRCKMIYDKGVSEWSNISTGMVSDTNELEQIMRFATVIPTPLVTLRFEVDCQPQSMIRAYTEELRLENNFHISSTWVIEDMNGKIKFLSKHDTINKNTITIPSVLDVNQPYILKVMKHMGSNDSSTFGTIPFYVSNDNKLFRNENPNIIYVKSGNFAIDVRRDGVDFVDILHEVYEEEGIIYSGSSIDGWVSADTILVNSSTSKSFWILRSSLHTIVNLLDVYGEWTYRFLIRRGSDYPLPAQIPYNVGTHEYTWETIN